MTGGAWAYLFEAKGIQPYILDSGRLVDLAGASDLIAELCASEGDDLLAEVLRAAGAEGLALSRRAGAAFCLHGADPVLLSRVRALWRLAVGLTRPGLAFVDTIAGPAASEIAALRAAYAGQSGLRENGAAMLLPVGHAVGEVSRRTGRFASRIETAGNAEERLDPVTGEARRRGRRMAAAPDDRLTRRFLPAFGPSDPLAGTAWRFPRHFERAEADIRNPAFPFRPGDSRVAIVHADLSGLGQFFRAVTGHAQAARDVLTAATEIERAIARAAQAATRAVLLPAAVPVPDAGPAARKDVAALFGLPDYSSELAKLRLVPARPLVLGGDDITILVRADLALSYTARLLEAIGAETAAALAALKLEGLPTHLTACAGIAVVASGHPFLAANRMAEGLCGYAKALVKAEAKAAGAALPASALALAVVTADLDRSFDEHRRDELTFDGQTPAAAVVYRLGGGRQPSVAGLTALAAALVQAKGTGKLREALGERRQGRARAEALVARFFQVLGQDDPAADARLRGALGLCLGLEGAPQAVQLLARLDDVLPLVADALDVVDIGAAAEDPA